MAASHAKLLVASSVIVALLLLIHTAVGLDLDRSELLISRHHHGGHRDDTAAHSGSNPSGRIVSSDAAFMVGDADVQPPFIQWGTNRTHVEIQLTYPTTGWLALGLTPHGGMDQSDVLFGYVVDATGEVVVQVRVYQSISII